MLTERWMPIPGLPGYEASSLGRVRSLPRRITQVRYGKSHAITAKGRVLKPRMINGYLVVQPRRPDHSIWSAGVHRLVLMAFSGVHHPTLDCRHLNGDRMDNRPENLEWGTRLDNLEDQKLHGTHPSQRLVTHCPAGHEYTPENTARRKSDGSRRCRQCDREYAREYQRRKRRTGGGLRQE
ncbi:HNH endonuclease [Mycobacterium phage ThreeRngTarjay]|nr:HNH endonuclease [Mycobacterium phage DmpstrDiver]AXQ52338.1 HNH endonuclease [Mycobacterium phage EricMillard]AYB69592.1 HNH endonuclease [Mycobacterium phage Kalah2]QBI97684.1 hypothetical protein SEA_HUGHESYANG_111 [Mycobacterium phage Hughesyang]QBI99863.1 HNH endonuclease [Mycobacterium phage ThreeRngTarjay]QBJ00063.1 HNH endonuclease [Mycobacterium phage Phoebus]QDP43858.1 HNH endonuclease [Mycobacterium phage Dallas]